ncbi:PAF1-like protein, partial [Mya arenaria]
GKILTDTPLRTEEQVCFRHNEQGSQAEATRYDYTLAREYNWNVKNKLTRGYEETYFMVFREDGCYYNELETRVRLSKRRKTAGAQVARSRLVVKHRDLNDRELQAQDVRLMMLEPPQDEEEEEEEEEEFIQTTNNDDEFPSPKGSGRRSRSRSRSSSRSRSGSRSGSGSRSRSRSRSNSRSRSRSRSKSGSRSRSRSRSGSRSLSRIEVGNVVAAGVLVVPQADLDQGQAVAA